MSRILRLLVAVGLTAAVLYNAERARLDHQRMGFGARRSLVCQKFVDTDLFRVSDRPVFEALGLYRHEDVGALDGVDL